MKIMASRRIEHGLILRIKHGSILKLFSIKSQNLIIKLNIFQILRKYLDIEKIIAGLLGTRARGC